MLDYISKRLQEMIPQQEVKHDEEQNYDDAVLEYASDIPELSDLTPDGKQTTERSMKGIDIPLEDDVELETIEINLTDGRLTDIPMDAAQMTEAAEYYANMTRNVKTYDDFYAEACEVFPQSERFNSVIEKRRVAYAESKLEEYNHQLIVQEGYSTKISMTDSCVPYNVTVDFGPMKKDAKEHYYQTLPCYFETVKGKILKKQTDSIIFMMNAGAFGKSDEMLRTVYAEKYNFGSKSVFDVLKPTALYVPIEPLDSFKVIVQLKPIKGGDEESVCVSWKIKEFETYMKGGKKALPTNGEEGFSVDITKIENTKNFTSRVDEEKVVEESYRMPYPNRFYQEDLEIDAAGSTDTPPADDNPPAAEDTATTDTPAEDKVEVDNNDVSQDIADKVAEKEDEKEGGDENITFDDTDTPPADDTATTDTPAIDGADDTTTDSTDSNDADNGMSPEDTTDVDAQLNDLDNMVGSTDDGSDDTTSDTDIENMTIDQMLAQGTEKLKGMTIGQLKSFMSQEFAECDGDGEFFDEAFFITRNNAAPTITECITNCLGVLNDDTMDFRGICKQFSKSSKKLVHALNKSIKIKQLFSERDRQQFITLVHNTNELQLAMKSAGKNGNDVNKIRTEILNFTKQATEVSKITREFVKGEKYVTPKNEKKGF